MADALRTGLSAPARAPAPRRTSPGTSGMGTAPSPPPRVRPARDPGGCAMRESVGPYALIRSKTAARAWPPPMHIVSSP